MTDFHFFHPVSSNPHRKPRVCRLISLAVGRIKKQQEKRWNKNPGQSRVQSPPLCEKRASQRKHPYADDGDNPAPPDCLQHHKMLQIPVQDAGQAQVRQLVQL